MTNEEIARCPHPKCGKPIFADHPYAWCKECGEPFPEAIRALIPEMQRLKAGAQQAKSEVIASATLASRSPYPALDGLLGWYRTLAVLNGVAAVILVIVGIATLGQQVRAALLLIVGGGVYGAVSVVTLLAAAEGIRLMIDVVANLRDIRDRLPARPIDDLSE
jgi:hypothetical protein